MKSFRILCSRIWLLKCNATYFHLFVFINIWTIYFEIFFICVCVCVCVCARARTCALLAQSCPTLCDPMGCSLARFLCSWNSPGQNTGVGSQSLLQGIFLTQDWSWVSHIAGRFFTIWATRKLFISLINSPQDILWLLNIFGCDKIEVSK